MLCYDNFTECLNIMIIILKESVPRYTPLSCCVCSDAVADILSRYDDVVSRSKLFKVSKCTYDTPLSHLPISAK